MEIALALTQHTIVLCVDKRERGLVLQTILHKAGYRVVIAMSLYDALKMIPQEMPHLIICEALLNDGTAGALYDKIQQHESLKKTPFLAHALRKSREELAPLAGRKFAGFFLGAVEPKAFLVKVTEVLAAHARVSPYFVGALDAGIAQDMTISIEAAIVGRNGERLISRSSAEVDPAASMLCVPASAEYKPAVLRLATNLRSGDEVFNLFPISRIVGAGRKWVLGLPEIKIGNDAPVKSGESAPARRVVFFDPSEARIEGFREILKGYGLDLIPAKSLAAATAIVKRDFESIHCVYLHELTNDGSGIEWKNVFAKLPPAKRPALIVGTTSANARSTSDVRYLKRPFGMGILVDVLQANCERPNEVAAVASKTAASNITGVAVNYQASASLVGIDEAGGIIQMKFPLLKGSKLNITHPFLQAAWDGKVQVQVTGLAALPDRPDVWHVRFDATVAGMSKVKYWEKVSKQLAQLPAKAS